MLHADSAVMATTNVSAMIDSLVMDSTVPLDLGPLVVMKCLAVAVTVMLIASQEITNHPNVDAREVSLVMDSIVKMLKWM